MKLNPIFGKGTGKVGALVFANVAGEQVVREYNGSVSNPNTEAQVGQRAKFKLASQLAATMSEEIAIPKKGMTSARNLFVKKNIGSISVTNDAASVSFPDLQLTDGSVNLGELVASYGVNGLEVSISGNPAAVADRVVYNVYKITADDELQFFNSKIVEKTASNSSFETSFTAENEKFAVYAYGIKDKNEAATTKYASYNIETSNQVAKLVATRTLSTSDYTFTKTIGAYVEPME